VRCLATLIKFYRYEWRCITVRRLKSWQIILIAAVLATIIVISGTFAYVEMNASSTLRISTTTSLYDTGLLTYIKTQYEATHKVTLHIMEQGTGLALASASAGDADIVLVHSPSQEYPYLANGTLVCRKIIAWNYFTIVGPASDPAKISGMNATQALKTILAYGRNQSSGTIVWVSRNDASGTFTKEVSLWKAANYTQATISSEPWYAKTGLGMGDTLRMADEENAYTLSDMGTFLQYSHQGSIHLNALIAADKSLINVYSVYAVNPQKISKVNFDQAIAFIEWLVSPEGQNIISTFGTGNYSQPLFHGTVQAFENPNLFQPDVSYIQSYAFFNGTECPKQFRDDESQLYP
jgi:tungstate transport system substrate-binding protein